MIYKVKELGELAQLFQQRADEEDRKAKAAITTVAQLGHLQSCATWLEAAKIVLQTKVEAA